MAEEKKSRTPEEQEQAFKSWLQKKTLKDTTFAYLERLDPVHAVEEENLKQVAVALRAAQQVLGDDDENTGGDDYGDPEDKKKISSSKDKPKSKTLKSVWASWTMKHHSFTDVQLKEDFVNKLSGGTRELLKETETEDPNNKDKKLKSYSTESLKYNFPEIPKSKGLQPRPMTPDQKLLNTIFMKEVKRVWQEAATELESQIEAAKAKGGRVEMPAFVEASGGVDLGFGKEESKDAGGDAKAEEKSGADKDKGSDAKGGADSAAAAPKDDGSGGKGKGGDEQLDEGKLTLKILNAMSIKRLRTWLEEDEDRLEAAKKEADREKRMEAKKGHEHFVLKHKDLEVERRRKEKKDKMAAEEKEEDDKVRAKAKNKASFEDWVVQKEMREQATKCLKLLDVPQLEDHEVHEYRTDTHEHVIKVGKALKKIDRTLLTDWGKWADQVLSFNTAVIMWDCFEPRACDVHSSAHSHIKDTFNKLLGPNVDVGAQFKAYIARRIKYEKQDDGPVDEKDIEDYSLNRKQMEKCLTEMGIHMKPMQMRMLIDAFDANSDGKITFKEFNAFVSGDRSDSINQKSVWNTTCPRTGMANAYSRSEPTAKQRRENMSGSDRRGRGADSKDADEGKDGDYEDDFGDGPGAGSSGGGSGATAPGKPKIIKLKNGEERIVVELADRVARDKLLVKYGVLEPPSDRPEEPPHRCQFSSWTQDKRKEGLQILVDLAKPAREEEVLKRMLTEGKPPLPPSLSMSLPKPATRDANDGNGEEDDDSYTSLVLEWDPVPGDLVSFYCLETCGPTGSTKQQPYKEVYRDPPSADPTDTFKCAFVVRDLAPGTSYQFRIRGFNGFGPGEYTYKIFTTRSSAPPAPRVVKISSDSVTLRWVFSQTFFKRLSELEALFRSIDTDHSGQVSRGELAAAMDAQSDASAALRSFLLKKADAIGVDISRGCGALFDAIEGDDNGDLSWEEFETFFLTAGWADTTKSLNVAASLRSSMGGAGAGAGAGRDLSYVVEQCKSELNATWSVAMNTSAGHGTVSRLKPGASYRFRVRSLNKDGVAGPCSEDVIVHTMLETPTAPTPVPSTGIKARSITLQWKRRGDSYSMRDPATVSKLLADWAGNYDEAEGGVSIELAFSKYDRNRSGDIDAAELALMLEDLGVETSEERLAEAFSILDTNGDGIITFDEFSAWWRRDEVTYILKRSEPVVPVTAYVGLSNSHDANKMEGILRRSNAAASSNSILPTVKEQAVPAMKSESNQATPVVVYRGDLTRYEVLGLEPNRLYHFKLRQAGSRCNSLISSAQMIMTAPQSPSQPLLIDIGSTTARVKWYSPPGGAYKFLVQLRPAKGGTSVSGATSDPSPGASKGWIPVFNGQETLWTSTTMVPGTEYDVRVLGVNYQGTMGEPSPACRFTTLPRGVSMAADKRDTDSQFNIECSGDICTGDTILITERLFVKDDGSGKEDTNANRSITSKSKIGGKAAVRMDMSVTSFHTDATGALPPGAYIGERTVAAHVVKDNYRTCRDAVAAKGLSPRDYKRFGKYRHLWLEVIWQRASNDACKPYELRTGEVIERAQGRLEEFEVFRTPWEREEQRVSLGIEWASQTDCFIAAACKPQL